MGRAAAHGWRLITAHYKRRAGGAPGLSSSKIPSSSNNNLIFSMFAEASEAESPVEMQMGPFSSEMREKVFV